MLENCFKLPPVICKAKHKRKTCQKTWEQFFQKSDEKNEKFYYRISYFCVGIGNNNKNFSYLSSHVIVCCFIPIPIAINLCENLSLSARRICTLRVSLSFSSFAHKVKCLFANTPCTHRKVNWPHANKKI